MPPDPPKGKGSCGPFSGHSRPLHLHWPLITNVIETPAYCELYAHGKRSLKIVLLMLPWLWVVNMLHWHTNFQALYYIKAGDAVASWLVRSTPDWAVRVRDLPGDIALCSWAKHFTVTVPLSTQVYKWVPVNLMLGVTLQWTSIPSRGE